MPATPPRPCPAPVPRLMLAGGLVLLLAGCGPITRVDDSGRATTVSWHRAMGFTSPSSRVAERGGEHAVGRSATDATLRAGRPRDRADRLAVAAPPAMSPPGATSPTRPDAPRPHARVASAPAPAAGAPALESVSAPASASPSDASRAVASAPRVPAASGHPASAELLGPPGSVQLVAADPVVVELAAGVAVQRAVIDPLLGAPAGPAELVGLDVPPDARVSAWVADAGELAAGASAEGAGIVVRFGAPMPHEIDGGIVGRLRASGWLALEVRSVGDDPARLAEAVDAACAAVEALGSAPIAAAAAPPVRRPLVLLGFGADGRDQALAVLAHVAPPPDAVVLVSEPDADTVDVRRLEHELRSAPVPVLHLRPADAVGEQASVRALVTRGGLDDREAARTGVTGWTYARRPAPGVAWLPMLVEPVADWVGRAAGTGADGRMPAAPRAPATLPAPPTFTVDGLH